MAFKLLAVALCLAIADIVFLNTFAQLSISAIAD